MRCFCSKERAIGRSLDGRRAGVCFLAMDHMPYCLKIHKSRDLSSIWYKAFISL